jgi:hypothetical protein
MENMKTKYAILPIALLALITFSVIAMAEGVLTIDVLPNDENNDINVKASKLPVLIPPQEGVDLYEIELDDAEMSVVNGIGIATPIESEIVVDALGVLQGLVLTYDMDDLYDVGLSVGDYKLTQTIFVQESSLTGSDEIHVYVGHKQD